MFDLWFCYLCMQVCRFEAVSGSFRIVAGVEIYGWEAWRSLFRDFSVEGVWLWFKIWFGFNCSS